MEATQERRGMLVKAAFFARRSGRSEARSLDWPPALSTLASGKMLIINADLAELLLLARSYDESVRQSRKTIEMDPNFALAHNQLAQAYLQKHMHDEAVTEMQKAVELSESSPTCI